MTAITLAANSMLRTVSRLRCLSEESLAQSICRLQEPSKVTRKEKTISLVNNYERRCRQQQEVVMDIIKNSEFSLEARVGCERLSESSITSASQQYLQDHRHAAYVGHPSGASEHSLSY